MILGSQMGSLSRRSKFMHVHRKIKLAGPSYQNTSVGLLGGKIFDQFVSCTFSTINLFQPFAAPSYADSFPLNVLSTEAAGLSKQPIVSNVTTTHKQVWMHRG